MHFVNALADAYASGARHSGHEVERIDVAALDFDVLRDTKAWSKVAPASLRPAQAAFLAADHLVFVYPLWMGCMPALMKALLEQLTAGSFAIEAGEDGSKWTQKLKGKSARVIVTMGMPATAYRYFFGAHSLKSFKRNILNFAGVNPVRDTVIGMVDARGETGRRRALRQLERLGRAAK
ncbi:MAG: NAD(P)H-dependent oxidoreductase [Parvularculaceae bacterium]